MIGPFINSGICIKADYFVGNTKAVLSVGFRAGKNTDFPVTLYKEDIRRLTHPSNKVLAILSKRHDEKIFSYCTYLSKGQELGRLQLPEEVRKSVHIEKERLHFKDSIEISSRNPYDFRTEQIEI